MKKIQTLLIMFSLFFLCNFSYAVDELYLDVFEELNLQPFTVDDFQYHQTNFTNFLENIEDYPYYYISTDNTGASASYVYMWFFSDIPVILKNSNRFGYYDYELNSFSSGYVLKYYYGKSDSAFGFEEEFSSSTWFDQPVNYSNIPDISTRLFDTFYSSSGWKLTGEQVQFPVNVQYIDDYYRGVSNSSLVMKNPLTDAEIKNILEIFLESVRNADLPEHYGRYVLTYNKITGRYTGFVYPSYIDLGIKYCDFDENDELYIVENSTGSYYFFTSYSEDSNYISQFLDGINLGMKHPLLYEFRSNSNNTYFKFNTTYDLGRGFENSFVLSTLDEPIIYTSHKIYSLFLTGTDILGFGKYEVDEETSIENQVFTDEETGLPKDTTINEYTDEVNSNVNLLSFIQLLFGFIFSFISFLVRFFTFIVGFIIVPASTNILPADFVNGIDWIHSFAFGEILLWDIFSIVFGILLALYIVKLIRSH